MLTLVTMTTMLTTKTTVLMSATMTTTMRKTTKTDDEAHDVCYSDRMSANYSVGLAQADFAADAYSQLRSVAAFLCARPTLRTLRDRAELAESAYVQCLFSHTFGNHAMEAPQVHTNSWQDAKLRNVGSIHGSGIAVF